MDTVIDEAQPDEQIMPICGHCGSKQVLTDAWAVWSVERQDWEVKATFDNAWCEECNGEQRYLEWLPPQEATRRRNQQLNDKLLKGNLWPHNRFVMTEGVHQGDRNQRTLTALSLALAAYDGFTAESDPTGEHSFGVLTVLGRQLYFKIDYYDLKLEAASPDPTDPAVTARVLTVFLPEEY
jgi:hypothetical protein